MKKARVEYQGAVHEVTVNADGSLLTPAGDKLPEEKVTWLVPNFGTVIALALNYADHASELEFKAPQEPLAFIKSASTFIGHKGLVYRPDNVDYMHYECELVAVLGKTARQVSRAEAMDYVSGYTLCNDYAVRDYLENYYRPNLRAKSHDSLSPLGPYVIDKDDVDDPHKLALRTYVNGEVRQEGSTKDMIFDIPFLVEYLSRFMTLQAGDMISTGTPKGLSDVVPGDEVTIEIEQVGKLTNYIVSEEEYFSEQTKF